MYRFQNFGQFTFITIIFWGNSVHNNYIFKIQKRTIRIITNAGIRDMCWDLFKKLQILPFYSQYIYSLLMFVIKIEICLNETLIFMNLVQDMIMIFTSFSETKIISERSFFLFRN